MTDDSIRKSVTQKYGVLMGEYILPGDTPIVMKAGYTSGIQYVVNHLSRASTDPGKAMFFAEVHFEATCQFAHANDPDLFSEMVRLPFGLGFTTASKALTSSSEVYQRLLSMDDNERAQACAKLADAWFDTLSEDDYPH